MGLHLPEGDPRELGIGQVDADSASSSRRSPRARLAAISRDAHPSAAHLLDRALARGITGRRPSSLVRERDGGCQRLGDRLFDTRPLRTHELALTGGGRRVAPSHPQDGIVFRHLARLARERGRVSSCGFGRRGRPIRASADGTVAVGTAPSRSSVMESRCVSASVDSALSRKCPSRDSSRMRRDGHFEQSPMPTSTPTGQQLPPGRGSSHGGEQREQILRGSPGRDHRHAQEHARR